MFSNYQLGICSCIARYYYCQACALQLRKVMFSFILILIQALHYSQAFGSGGYSDDCIHGTNSVRLVDGNSNSSGRIEVCQHGIWGTVCDNGFGIVEGSVVCKQLGFAAGALSTTRQFGPGTGPIWLNNIFCEGSESSLFDCTSSDVHDCHHYEDIGVMCISPKDDCTSNSVRLVDGSSNSSGRVEVCQHSIWGTVCDFYFGTIEGHVICKQLGFIDVKSITYEFGPGAGPIWIDEVHCKGNESSLFDCNYHKPYDDYCQHYHDIGVICHTADDCTSNSVRLVDGSSNSSGRVEVCQHGTWGTVCDYYFGTIEGHVICKQLGFIDVKSITYEFGPGAGPIWIEDVHCKGNESSLFDCSYHEPYDDYCQHYDDIGVICHTAAVCKDGSVRLSEDTRGLLDLCVDGIWGYMSSDHFDDCDGRVACRQLGYSGLVSAIILEDFALYSEYFNNDFDDFRIWSYKGIHCLGNESNLYDCFHTGNPQLLIDYDDIFYYTGVGYSSTTGIVQVQCFDIINVQQFGGKNTVILGPDKIEETVNFTCSANITNPMIKWTWMFQDKELEPGVDDDYTITQSQRILDDTTSSTLRILNPRKANEGSYHCFLNYIAECSNVQNIQQTHYLELKAMLTAFASSSDTSASENSKTLSCELTGYIFSDTTIEWFRDGNSIQTIRNVYFISVSKGNSLQLINSQGNLVQNMISTLYIYTTDVEGNYECVVLNGDNRLHVNFTLDYDEETQATSSVAGIAAGSVGAFMCLICCCAVFITCAIMFQRYLNKRKNPTSMTEIDILQQAPGSCENDHDYIRMSNLHKTCAQQEKLQEIHHLLSCIIDPLDLKIIEKVGQGEFGAVYRGALRDKSSSTTTVAIKTLRGLYSESQVDELFVEADKMKSFDHLHVLSLTGICVGLLESPCIVMPFMSNGSLLSYLRREAADLTINEMADETLFNSVVKHLLSICLQVAKGMEYLAQQKFIHRDLATRNCMISSEGIIKIADFGLAEDIYTTVYFKQDQSSCSGNDERSSVKLPLKWMALESIHYGKFDEKTDVWSYGVLCWEVFNGAKTPYPGFTPKEVVTLLDSGERLTKPANAACTEEVFSMMMSCWEKAPKNRPNFFELVEKINQLLVPLADYMDMSDLRIN